MSYDYIAILSKITEHRRQAYETPNEKKDGDKLHHLQQSFDTFSSFSNDCPMTPMLWMQYAFDASEVVENLLLTAGNDSESSKRQAFETRRSILELGLNEFPGCAFLRLMNFDTLLFCTTSSFSDTEKRDEEMSLAEQLFETSLASVGLGSHRNDDTCIMTLYRIWIRFLLKSHVVSENNGSITDNGKQKIRQLFQRRARIPTKNGNDTIIDEIQTLDQEYNLKMTPRDYALVDEGKRFASKYFGRLTIFEDDVEASMAQDNIVSSSLHHIIENENSSSEFDADADANDNADADADADKSDEITNDLYPQNQGYMVPLPPPPLSVIATTVPPFLPMHHYSNINTSSTRQQPPQPSPLH